MWYILENNIYIAIRTPINPDLTIKGPFYYIIKIFKGYIFSAFKHLSVVIIQSPRVVVNCFVRA
jgi:hypothetical protein